MPARGIDSAQADFRVIPDYQALVILRLGLKIMSLMVHALDPTNKRHVTHHVRLNLPKRYIEVNVDDSSFGNHDNACFGGLLRNNMIIWVHNFFFLILW